jgi:hypothetical protein
MGEMRNHYYLKYNGYIFRLEAFPFLGCYAMYFGSCLPTFREDVIEHTLRNVTEERRPNYTAVEARNLAGFSACFGCSLKTGPSVFGIFSTRGLLLVQSLNERNKVVPFKKQ